MACEKCQHIVDREDVPHVIRVCSNCGREMHVVEPGKHGRGIQIREGDRFVLPAGWLQLSFNPLKSTGSFSRDGLQWLAEIIFLDKLPTQRGEFLSILQRLEDESDSFLNNSALLEGMNVNNPEHAEPIFQKLQAYKNTKEWWVMWEGQFTALTRQSIAEGDAEKAAWAMGCAERCRTMALFKEHIEEVIMMGHSAKRIIDILHIWDNNKCNNDEEFWQLTFNENSLLFRKYLPCL